MRNLDFTSWQALLSTLLGLAIITIIGVGIRLIITQTIQHRRERENRQINERLRALISAYKVLGGSFTGDLVVDPTHMRDLRANTEQPLPSEGRGSEPAALRDNRPSTSDRSRRIRDAVEGALSDIILLGTDEQVRLAAAAASELRAGRAVHTAELVVSLRNFIRQVLDLNPVPAELPIPKQGPARPSSNSRGAKTEGGGNEGRGKQGGGTGGAGGAGAGMGLGFGSGSAPDDEHLEEDR